MKACVQTKKAKEGATTITGYKPSIWRVRFARQPDVRPCRARGWKAQPVPLSGELEALLCWPNEENMRKTRKEHSGETNPRNAGSGRCTGVLRPGAIGFWA